MLGDGFVYHTDPLDGHELGEATLTRLEVYVRLWIRWVKIGMVSTYYYEPALLPCTGVPVIITLHQLF